MNRKIGVILSYIHMVFEVLSTLLLTPFIISSLGDAEYGVYKLIAAITSYLLLLDLGMGNSVIRYVAKYKENNDLENTKRCIGVSLVFYAIVSMIVLILGYLLIVFFKDIFATGLTVNEIELGKKLLVLTVLNAAVTLSTSVFINILVAYSKFRLVKGFSILQIVARIIVTVIALMCGCRSIALVTINLLLTVITRGFYAGYVLFVMKLKPKLKGANSVFIKDITTYSAFILLQMIATQINGYADQVLLGMLVKSSSVIIGIYGVGAQVVQYFQSIGHAIGSVLMPGVVNMVEGGATPKQMQNEMVRIGRYSFMILGIIFVGFLVNGQTFLMLWVGEGYSQSYYISLILMFAYLFILIESIGSQVLWAKNKHRSQSVIKFTVVLINVILTVFLIKWSPLLGATIGTFISLILGDVICMNVVFKKEIGISLKEYYTGLFKGILPCLVLSCMSGYVISLLNISGLIGFVINIVIMIAVYIATMCLFGFNEGEKKMLIGLFRKIIKQKR